MRDSVRDRLDRANRDKTSNSNKFGAIDRTVGYKADVPALSRNKQHNPAVLAKLLELHRIGDVCAAGTCKICYGQHKRRFYG